MFYVGLDIHDQRIAICVLGQTGQIVRRAQVRTIEEMMRMLSSAALTAAINWHHRHHALKAGLPGEENGCRKRGIQGS
jgi:hypothetical protein